MVTSRVLPAGMTQITAMRSLNPTFVSVELGGNELLPAQVGLLFPGVTFTPFATFQANYAQVIDNVKARFAEMASGLPNGVEQRRRGAGGPPEIE